jgi:hypothetical protein
MQLAAVTSGEHLVSTGVLPRGPMAFRDWLRNQKDRLDKVGDLARDTFSNDGIRLPKMLTPGKLRAHMIRNYNPCDGALEAMDQAEHEFRNLQRWAPREDNTNAGGKK